MVTALHILGYYCLFCWIFALFSMIERNYLVIEEINRMPLTSELQRWLMYIVTAFTALVFAPILLPILIVGGLFES